MFGLKQRESALPARGALGAWYGVLVGLLMLLSTPARAQQDDSLAITTTAEARAFDQVSLEELRSNYDYDKDLETIPTLWERFKNWLAEALMRFLNESSAGFISDNIFYLLVFVILVFAVYILSRGRLRDVFHGAPRSAAEVMSLDEGIHELDLNAMIASAESEGDLPRAIRLHYLLVLRNLVDQGWIEWTRDRTDRDYVAQIKDPELRLRFSDLAAVFQWVWYGHGTIDRTRYELLKERFTAFQPVPNK